MERLIIRNVLCVNEGQITPCDVSIKDGRFEKISPSINLPGIDFDGAGKHLFPGIIDDQVHFREPGLTHKADIASESKAAVSGGCTSFMEMPNTKPPATTQDLLQNKYDIAAQCAPSNYSFYMGVSNDNLEEVLKTDPKRVCGIKIFMGSSTGNMLVDNPSTLKTVFRETPCLIATHCEDEKRVNSRLQEAKAKFGDDIPADMHPVIRDAEACYLSSSYAVELAKKYNTRLHVLHITTAEELSLFDSATQRKDKRITAEVCVHHLCYNDSYYASLGHLIKCNPAIKSENDRKALMHALKNGLLDVVATDHAPHTLQEKQNNYMNAPSGLPLVAHAFQMMLYFYHNDSLSLPFLADKMSHAVADIFQIKNRGYIREGYWADCFLADVDMWGEEISPDNIPYKCKWSPLQGKRFKGIVEQTWVNGVNVYNRNTGFTNKPAGMRLEFDR
jgi:dihydroorotase